MPCVDVDVKWRTTSTTIYIYEYGRAPAIMPRLDKYVYMSIDSIGTPLKLGTSKNKYIAWRPKAIDG